MNIVRTIADVRTALEPHRRAGRTIGFVPTMGYFHAGHASLMRRARETSDVVVVSLFVNPTQFNDPSDLTAYPRDEERDAALASTEGVDILFAPAATDVYPPGFATTVVVTRVTEQMEGATRGVSHFVGVATVVAKLFNMVQPTTAFFGQKDAQQALVVRRMTRDLDIPVRIEVCPTVREPDGLAMSSRNVRLSAAARDQALALSAALSSAERAVAAGVRDARVLLDSARAVMRGRGVEPEYLEIVSADTLAAVDRIAGEALMAVAAHVGGVRLIDNVMLRAG
ncbi:MAG: Pantothenate synthetase [Gemmatimonadetes bacterium]|nr:Pantothenate synthetase [Gemmatimonadota bacterium]